MTVAIVILVLIALLALGVWLAGRVGASRMRALYDRERHDLMATARGRPPVLLESEAVGHAPEPVQRYLRAIGGPPSCGLRVATLHQTGGIRTAADKPWMPFLSVQTYTFDPPGFTWFARARFLPCVEIVARDKLADERGHMLIRLLGLLPIADAGGPEIDQGAGLRFWGEVLSFPEIVLHPRLRWEPIDEDHARLRVLGPTQLEAVVEFGEDGLPCAFHAHRHRDLGGGRSALTPWTGHCTEWGEVDGRRFPTRWLSVWHLEDGDFPAVRMEVTGVEVE